MESTPLFVPRDYVPLSEFVADDPAMEALKLAIKPEIIDYVSRSGGKLSAARLIDGIVHLEEVVIADAERGEISVRSGLSGVVVAVSEVLRNGFPISTNWDSSMNEGRGGVRPGGTDGIGWLRHDASSGEIRLESDLADESPEGMYRFATDRYALFSGERGGAYERLPGFERYIGESYSLYGVEEEVAIKLSLETLRSTGYPVLYRNAESGEGEALGGMPVFQIWNNRIIQGTDSQSLMTVLLPPNWTPAPAETPSPTGTGPSEGYPCLFSGYYDQNENVYMHCGLPLLKAIGQTMERTGKGAVGIIWNGGGSIGTRTQHPSALEQLNELFQEAAASYNINPRAIVAVGGSRGGLTALLAASNPFARSYSIRYALCYGVPLSLYGPVEHLLNVTYPARWDAICSDLGLKDAWRTDWRDENGQSAVERYMRNTLGTVDQERINGELHPISEVMLEALRRSGTKVLFNTSTHDPFTAFWPALDWTRRARSYGIPVRHEIGYRHGHNNCTDPYENAATYLEAVVRGKELELQGTFHYRRKGEGDERWRTTEAFEPERQPVFFEGPKRAVAGLTAVLSIYGAPGMAYRLSLVPDKAEGDEGLPLKDGDIVLMEGSLPGMEAEERLEGMVYATRTWEVPLAWGGASYRYNLMYKLDEAGAGWQRVSPEGVPHPVGPRVPELVVLGPGDAPSFTSAEWHEATMVHFIGWGLSEA